MKPIVTAERNVGDHESANAACMTAAMPKQPSKLTITVPYGKVLPNRCAAQSATRYRVPVPAAPARQIQKRRSMSRHLAAPRHECTPTAARRSHWPSLTAVMGGLHRQRICECAAPAVTCQECRPAASSVTPVASNGYRLRYRQRSRGALLSNARLTRDGLRNLTHRLQKIP